MARKFAVAVSVLIIVTAILLLWRPDDAQTAPKRARPVAVPASGFVVFPYLQYATRDSIRIM